MITKRILLSILVGVSMLITSLQAQQRAIPTSPTDQSFVEGMEHYTSHNYSIAKDRFTSYLAIPANERTEDFHRLSLQAKLYSKLASLWLGHDVAQYELERLVADIRPEKEAWVAAMEVGNALYNKKRYRQAQAFYDQIDISMLDEKDAAEVSFKRGYCFFIRKKYDLADQALAHASATNSQYFYPANYYLGMSAFLQDDYDKAAAYFERVKPSKQYKAYVPFYLSQIYFNRGAYQQVVSYAEPLLSVDEIEKKDEIKNLIGRSYFELGQESKALKYMQEVEQSEVKLTAADYYQIGYLSYKDENYPEAIKQLKQVAALNNKTGEQANYYLGHAYIKNQNKEAARSAFANVKRKTKNKTLKDEATYNYGLLSAELNHDREAVNALMEIGPTSSYYSVAQEALAKLFLRTNDFDNALTILQSIDRSTPTLKEAYQKVNYLKGQQLLNNGQAGKAIPYFSKSIENPINQDILAESYFSKGLALHQLRKYRSSNQAISQYETLRSSSSSSDLHYAKYTQGYNYLKQKKYAEAKTAFQQAAQLLKNNSAAKKQYADALIREGDCAFHYNNYAEALDAYKSAYGTKQANYIYAYYQTGVIYGLKKDHIQAIVIYEDIHKKYPKSPWADDALVGASQSYLALGEYDKAAQPLLTLTKSYKQSDKLADAYLTLGLISYNRGAVDQSIQFYKRVFANNPSATQSQDASRALQEIYIHDIKDIDEYLAFMETVSGGTIENNVRDSLNYQTAYVQYTNANYKEAEQKFTKYITNFPDGLHQLEARYLRGECYALDQDYSNAYRDYTYVIDQGNSRYYEKSLRKAALIAYNDILNYDKAYEYFSRLSQLNISSKYQIEAYLGAMRSAFRLERFDDARSFADLVYTHPQATNEDRAAADYYLSTILYEEGKYDEALISLNRLSKQSNDENAAQARYLIADIYYKKKEMQIAEEMCRLAIKDNANYPFWVAKSIILLSDILVEKGDTFNAKAALEAVIENFNEEPTLIEDARQKLNAIRQKEQRANPILRDTANILQTEEQ